MTRASRPIANADAPSTSVLVVSAFAPELAPLRRRLRARAKSNGAPSRSMAAKIVCLPVGIGLVEAALGAARAIEQHAPKLVIFVGTGGAYTRAIQIGTVAIASDVALVSTAVVRGDGYVPAPVPMRQAATSAISRRLVACAQAIGCPAAPARVANPLAITNSATLARKIAAQTESTVENLEVFAVARAAHTHRLPFAAVLGIANRVGPSAHQEWLTHQAAASEAACAVVAAYLDSLTR